MLNYEFPPIGGGAANANFQILKKLSKKNIKIDVVTSSPNKKFLKEKFSKNITIYRVNVYKKNVHYWTMKEILTYTRKTSTLVNKLVNQNTYDLCHSFFTWPTGLIAYVFRKKIPYIVSLRGSDVPGFNPRLDLLYRPLQFLSRLIWSNAEKVVANSHGLKLLAEKTWNGKIDVIYNGIDTEKFNPRKSNHKNLVILTVARLIPRKGLDYLIKSIPNIVKKNKNIELRIIGEGSEKKKLVELAKELGIKKYVKFVGYVPHKKLPKHYRNSDVFILPSLYEGMSNTVLEALASGLPIITTNTGGTKELIDKNGIIIKKSSIIEIENAILSLTDKKRLKMGEISRKTALKFTWKEVADRYFKIYKELIK